MFCFVNLSTLLFYGAGAALVGGGGYTVWCFKDTISTSVTPATYNKTQSSPDSPKHKDNKFQKDLDNITKAQEKLVNDEKQLDILFTQKEELQNNIGVLEAKIQNAKVDFDKWVGLEKASSQKLEALKTTKDAKDEEVATKEREYNHETTTCTSLEATTTTLSNALKNTQQELNKALNTKEQAEKDFEQAVSDLSAQEKLLEKIEKSIQELTTKQDLKNKEVDEKKSTDSQISSNIATKQDLIKQKITSNIAKLNQEIQAIDAAVSAFQKEIDGLQAKITGFTQQINDLGSDPDKKTQKDSLTQQKSTEQNKINTKTTQKNNKAKEKGPKETLKIALTNLKDNITNYVEDKFSSLNCDQAIKDELEQLKDLNSNKITSAKALKVLEDEKQRLTDKLSEAQAQKNTETEKKNTLSRQKTEKETAKTQTISDYQSKKAADDEANRKHKESLDQWKSKTLELTQKQISYEETVREQSRLETYIADEEAEKKDLETKKISSEIELKRQEGEKTTQDKALKHKQQEIDRQETTINTQKQ